MQLISPVRLFASTALTALGLMVAGSLVAQTMAMTDIALKDGVVEDVTPTQEVMPLTSTLQPTTPWPVATSQTIAVPQHNLLAYEGVDMAVKGLLNGDYAVWKSHFADEDAMTMQPVPGMMMLSGCTKDQCDMHKSLLVVNPATQKVYAAMVTEGKMAMWPSLMAWPDEAIPALKTWLADATDGKSETK